MSPMDIWFLIGVLGFAMVTLAHLVNLWSANDHSSRLARFSLRSLDACMAFWVLLLICWGWRHESGLSRLLLGSSALAISGAYRIALLRYPLHGMGVMIAALATALSTFAFLFSKPLDVPNWLLKVHIGFAITGVTVFAFSAALSALYLIQERRLKSKQRPVRGSHSRLPSVFVLDQLSYKGILIAFSAYTVALLLGGVQAVRSQGDIHLSYLVAVGSWLIYGAVLQARLTAGWRGRRAAWLTLIAFIGVLTVTALYTIRGTN